MIMMLLIFRRIILKVQPLLEDFLSLRAMAANILAREFKIPMKDYICIDISPDVHVKRVFKRLGFIPEDASNDELIYCARDLNPYYPGIFDLSCWEIGREWCKPQKPNCQNCYLNEHCPKENQGAIS